MSTSTPTVTRGWWGKIGSFKAESNERTTSTVAKLVSRWPIQRRSQCHEGTPLGTTLRVPRRDPTLKGGAFLRLLPPFIRLPFTFPCVASMLLTVEIPGSLSWDLRANGWFAFLFHFLMIIPQQCWTLLSQLKLIKYVCVPYNLSSHHYRLLYLGIIAYVSIAIVIYRR